MDEDLSPPDPNRKAMLPENDTDKLLAWHPHKQMLAVAQPDGTVYIYENDEKALDWHHMVLRHQLMQSITCIEWKQRANGTLAVGCRYMCQLKFPLCFCLTVPLGMVSASGLLGTILKKVYL